MHGHSLAGRFLEQPQAQQSAQADNRGCGNGLTDNPDLMAFDRMRSAAQGKTSLVIAHRLSTVVEAHEILVMDSGRIIERGTHEELLAAGGRYSSMWNMQLNQAESAEIPA